ncbi:MAG: glycosyltransferase family 4 protein [Patescibacteria group bacterium]
MKICFLTHNLRQDNGAGVFSRRLIAELSKTLNAEAVVLTAVPAGMPYELPLLSGGKMRVALRLWRIRRAIQKCDLVHALDVFPYGIIAAVASLGLGKKLIITAIGSGSILPLYHSFYAPLARMAYRRAAAITAISAFTKGEILKKMLDLKIEVINPGVDIQEFATSDLRPPTSDPIQKYKPYILSVGQLRWRKGYHLSIRAFAKIASRFPSLHYVIIGKHYTDIYDRRLEHLIVSLGLQERVHILTHIDTRAVLAAFYKNAQLFCLFSQNLLHDVEGFGLVFLEAAAAGLPVVGSKNCGIDDAVRDGENGILVPTRDPEDFAQAIITILGDEKLKKEMRMRSLALARSAGWEKRIAEYHGVYEDLGLR